MEFSVTLSFICLPYLDLQRPHECFTKDENKHVAHIARLFYCKRHNFSLRLIDARSNTVFVVSPFFHFIFHTIFFHILSWLSLWVVSGVAGAVAPFACTWKWQIKHIRTLKRACTKYQIRIKSCTCTRGPSTVPSSSVRLARQQTRIFGIETLFLISPCSEFCLLLPAIVSSTDPSDGEKEKSEGVRKFYMTMGAAVHPSRHIYSTFAFSAWVHLAWLWSRWKSSTLLLLTPICLSFIRWHLITFAQANFDGEITRH